MILLTQSGIVPASDTWNKWTPIFAVVATLGACILAVSMASWILKRFNDVRYEGSTREASNRKWEAALEAGVKNLDVLNETETAYLVWILRRGQRRFRADFPSYSGNNLGPKNIIFNSDEHARDVYQVNPKVWEMREQLISRFSQISLPAVAR